ncbi:PREDICTED: uncharacterized protein LOC109326386 [Lupinus angustifolius]|uniref:uncharacterized protein LOC109326386 n=1 Tax=Lupinus angustifolius TaxID=3871 RepID=UPI00092F1348|nr:PREDICTED: uncharacterized protein LOC109326386 [Lupinus angustifolius]
MESLEATQVTQYASNYNDIQNPYYLHRGESPGAVLVTPPLDGSNYHTWSRAMKRALLSKNKFKFVNGSIKPPSEVDPEYDTWERCNTMILSWFTRSMTKQIGQSTIYIDNAQELWEDLKERFSKGNYFRISNVLQELHSIRQGDKNIFEYFNDVKTLWDELESLRPLPSCQCETKCKCQMMKIVKNHRDVEYVICFLKGLNDEFNTIKAHILLMEPLPQINKACSLLLQQEEQQVEPRQTNPKALFNTSDKRQQSDPNESRQQ